MQLISKLEQLRTNVKTLDDYFTKGSHAEKKWALDRVRRGTCFVVYKVGEELRFAPSRFIGYVDNTIGKHDAAVGIKDGRKTNPVISGILACEPSPNDGMELEYLRYCTKLGIMAPETGSHGAARKFWREKITI